MIEPEAFYKAAEMLEIFAEDNGYELYGTLVLIKPNRLHPKENDIKIKTLAVGPKPDDL